MSNQQFGFIPGRSTNDAIFYITRDLFEANNSNQPSAVVFIDLRKAFDTINHMTLFAKLFNYGVSGQALEWIQSYLAARTQYTVANNTVSGTRGIPCGVPQGSVLGPLLFLVYINSVENAITNTKGYVYADDLALVCSERTTPVGYNCCHELVCKQSAHRQPGQNQSAVGLP